MKEDRIEQALVPESQLVVAVATTTAVCRAAQKAHSLSPVPSIALGRLLTATALAGLMQERKGDFSAQIIGQGKLGPMFADVTEQGHLRGYIKNPQLVLPLLPGESNADRRSIAHAVSQGVISVIRASRSGEIPFAQSATPLVSGEVDLDVAHFLQQSDQIATVLVADVLLTPEGAVERAGGVLIQALPGGNLERLEAFREQLDDGRFAKHLGSSSQPAELMRSLVPEAVPTEAGTTPLCWRCRCSHERVLGALRMLDSVELAELVSEAKDATVRCDFCSKSYVVTPAEIESVYQATLKARG